MERNSTIAAWRLPGGINSEADKGVSAMILSYHDSVPPAFADKQVKAYGQGRRGFNQNVDGQEAYFGRPFGTRDPLASNPALKRWAYFRLPAPQSSAPRQAGSSLRD